MVRRIFNGARIGIGVRIESRHLCALKAHQATEVGMKPAGHATVAAFEIAFEKTLGIEQDHDLAGRALFLAGAERAGSDQVVAFDRRSGQMGFVECLDLVKWDHALPSLFAYRGSRPLGMDGLCYINGRTLLYTRSWPYITGRVRIGNSGALSIHYLSAVSAN
jgi:hypothetical protein